MQEFTVTLKVTVNALETVSSSEVYAELADVLEGFDGGTVEVLEVEEK